VVIPGSIFDAGEQFLVTGYGIPEDEQHSYTIPIRVRQDAMLNNVDPSYVYKKTLRVASGNSVFPNKSQFATREWFNGRILTPYQGKLRYISVNADSSFSLANQLINNISLTALANANMVVIPLANDRIMVDYAKTAAGITSRTDIYNINYFNETATLLRGINNADHTLGSTNSYVLLDTNRVIVGRLKASSLVDTDLSAIPIGKTLISLPTNEKTVELITKDIGNSILVFCTNAVNIYSYSLDTGTYIVKYPLPVAFRGRRLKQQLLTNGDVVVWKPLRTEIVGGVSVSDTVVDMLYIDNTNSTCTHITPIGGRTSNILGSVLNNDGSLFLISNNITGPNTLVFE